MDLQELLARLCAPLGPPGREDEIRGELEELLKPLAREIRVDRLGSLAAFFGPEDGPRVMLDAHMDECALVVQRIEDNGFCRVAAMGGVDPRVLPASRVVIQAADGSHMPGIIGLAPPHVAQAGDDKKAIPWDKTWLDLGFASGDEAREAGVMIGSAGVLDCGMGPVGGRCFHARNLDDRVGCAILVDVARRLAADPPPVEVVLSFAVAEEVGLRGAGAAAFSLEPDLALVVEATMGDTPGLDPGRQPSLLGQGPAVTVMDGRIIVPWRLVESLEAAAERAGVACQRKLPPYGGTDAGVIHVSRGGVPTCIVSVPCRYLHTPVSLLDLDDLGATTELVWAWLGEVESLL